MAPRPTLLVIPLAALALALASCGDESPTSAAGAGVAEAERLSASSSAEQAERAQPAADTGGSCADQLQPGSVQAISCMWIADADRRVCETMSDGLLSTLFGGRGAAAIKTCKKRLDSLPAVEEKALVAFGKAVLDDDRATLEVIDEAHSPRLEYRFTFVLNGGRWLIDTTEHVSAAPATETPPAPVSPDEAAAAGEIRELLQVWYAEANPEVCDFMTPEMLVFGWGKTGDGGRELCRTNLAEADQLDEVRVRRPRVDGDTAAAEVVYTLDGERQFDRVSLVRRDGEWLVDSVELAGFVPEE